MQQQYPCVKMAHQPNSQDNHFNSQACQPPQDEDFLSFLTTAQYEFAARAVQDDMAGQSSGVAEYRKRKLPATGDGDDTVHEIDFGNKYRKDSPPRIILPVVFRVTEKDKAFWDMDQNQIAQDLVDTLQKDVVYQRLSRRGQLTVCVNNADAAIKLLDVKTLAGVGVEAYIPPSLIKNEGKIIAVPYRYSEDRILEELAPYGVVGARREVKAMKLENGGLTFNPRGVVILTFKPEVPLPKRVHVGQYVFPVEEYLEPPLQCFNCMRFGHSAKVCRANPRCRQCAGAHNFKECKSKVMLCCNCLEEHRATFAGCSKRRDAAFAQRVRKFRKNEEEDE